MAMACKRDPAIEPDAANHDRYEAVYEHYREVVGSPVVRMRAAPATEDRG
jgi:hypothetical protein